MCGIAGILNHQKTISIVDLKRMTDVIHHRGPDGEGQWINSDSSVGLGHRRLAILDLSENGHQPMHFGNNRFTITFNGEIYNYEELKKSPHLANISFRSDSDTEVLVALYAKLGASCLGLLEGMFSFAIWDEQEKQLFCARDRFGEKPFYFAYETGAHFVFGSEIKQLFEWGIKKEANDALLFQYLQNNNILHDPTRPDLTFYKNVFSLEPAHFMVIDSNLNLTKKRYWDLDIDIENTSITLTEAAEKFYELFERSVKMRLRSDVPVGSSLSGGLDSSAIVCMVDKLTKNETIDRKTFSARFPNFARDEGKFMHYVVERTNVEPHYTFPTAALFSQEFNRLCYHQEEPFNGPSAFAQWEVMKLAKSQNVTVLLDGQGADESLAGYHYYYETYLKELQLKESEKYFIELAAYRDFHNPYYLKEQTELPLGTKEKLKSLLRPAYRKLFPLPQEKTYLSTDFLNTDFIRQFDNTVVLQGHQGGLKEQLYVNNCVIGLNNLLRFADRNSMAFSREMRLPFLDHHLVEFVFSLPNEFKIHEGWTKYVMRIAMEDLLPPEITWRKDKIGYEPPFREWMQDTDVKDAVADALKNMEQQGIVNKKRKQTGFTDEWNALVVSNTLYK